MSRSGRVVVALGLPVLVTLAACGGGASSSGLPTVGTTTAGGGGTPTPTVTSSSPWTPEQQEVLDRFLTYDRVVTSMDAGAALDMAGLNAVATKSWAQEIGQNIQVTKAQDVVIEYPAGGIRRDFTEVSIDGTSATIVGCEDASGIKVSEKGTPQPSASDAYKPTRLVVSLASAEGTWKVSKVGGGEGSC